MGATEGTAAAASAPAGAASGRGFGFGGFPPGGGPRGRGRKARRGDIRTAALLLLAEEPRNGYQIMQEVRGAQRRRLAPEPRLGLPGARSSSRTRA